MLDGEIVNTPLAVNQGFLIFAVVYIVPASLMVYLSLTLAPVANRRANIIVAAIYMVTVALSCIGESWLYFWLGSARRTGAVRTDHSDRSTLATGSRQIVLVKMRKLC